MEIQLEYNNSGIIFHLVYQSSKLTFPMNLTRDDCLEENEWVLVNVLEQLWLQGLLTSLEDGYLLESDAYFALDTELQEVILSQIEKDHDKNVIIAISEYGNTAISDYKIIWYIQNDNPGNLTGGCSRTGIVASSPRNDYILNKHQYDLIKETEKYKDCKSNEDRARYRARCISYAQKAQAGIPDRMNSVSYLFSDHVDIDINVENDNKIRLCPKLRGIPKEYGESIQGYLFGSYNFPDNTCLYINDETNALYNKIKRISIKRSEVPEFMENPVPFISENSTYDQYRLVEKTRKIDIRRSTAIPFIHVDECEKKHARFHMGRNILLRDTNGNFDDAMIEDQRELQEFFRNIKRSRNDYIYFRKQWIKVNKEQLNAFHAINQKAEEMIDSEYILPDLLERILKEYESVEGIEYDDSIMKLETDTLKAVLDLAITAFLKTLQSYQNADYDYVMSCDHLCTDKAIHDDSGIMRSWKKEQIYALLSYMYDRDELSPALLIIPDKKIDHLYEELKKTFPYLDVYIYRESDREKKSWVIRSCDIILTTCHTLFKDKDILGKTEWSCVICNLINDNDIDNNNDNDMSLWSFVAFRYRSLLECHDYYKADYERSIHKSESVRSAHVQNLIPEGYHDFSRKTKENDIRHHLSEIYIPIEMSYTQEILYNNLLRTLRSGDERTKAEIIKRLILLSSHPGLQDERDIANRSVETLVMESGKLQWIRNFLCEIKDTKKKVVIISSQKLMQSILYRVISETSDIHVSMLNEETKADRLDIIQHFRDEKESHVLILSPEIEGIECNIMFADHVIHYTREWNPAIENQVAECMYHISQIKDVSIYYPIVTFPGGNKDELPEFITVEQKLDELLKEKKKLVGSSIIPSNHSVNIGELMRLF